jgi:1,4-dihydroxy-2-naphthoyl-CoA synthase
MSSHNSTRETEPKRGLPRETSELYTYYTLVLHPKNTNYSSSCTGGDWFLRSRGDKATTNNLSENWHTYNLEIGRIKRTNRKEEQAQVNTHIPGGVHAFHTFVSPISSP